jgi:hypothetical protein
LAEGIWIAAELSRFDGDPVAIVLVEVGHAADEDAGVLNRVFSRRLFLSGE